VVSVDSLLNAGQDGLLNLLAFLIRRLLCRIVLYLDILGCRQHAFDSAVFPLNQSHFLVDLLDELEPLLRIYS
jgi:hypothetical protein